MSLAQEIKKRLGQKAQPPTAVPGQEQTARVLTTKATGRAAPSLRGPRASAIGEAVARQQADVGLEQQRQAGVMAGEKLAAAEAGVQESLAEGRAQLESQRVTQKAQQATRMELAENQRLAQEDESMARLDAQEQSTIAELNAQKEQKLMALASHRKVSLDDIWTSFKRSRDELEFRKDASELEQTAHDLRLRDRQYVDQITRIAKLRGLEDEIAFRKEASRLTLGEQKQRLIDDMGFRATFDAGEREFATHMASIDMDQAMAIYDAEVKSAATQAIIGGTATAATGAVQGGMFKASPTPGEATPTSTPYGEGYKTEAGPEVYL